MEPRKPHLKADCHADLKHPAYPNYRARIVDHGNGPRLALFKKRRGDWHTLKSLAPA